MLHRVVVSLTSLLVASAALAGYSKVADRLDTAADVMDAVLDLPEGIPAGLLDAAECVVVLPSVKKFAVGFGGTYGRGAMVCRSGDYFTGAWGAPAMVRLEGGNFGLQLGGEATDFVLLVMNRKGVDSLLRSSVKLGVAASIAAGPKGRLASAETDARLRAEILSYSRTRGLFVGLSLEGTTLRQDRDANETLYQQEIEAREIVRDARVDVPEAADRLVDLLQAHSPSYGDPAQP